MECAEAVSHHLTRTELHPAKATWLTLNFLRQKRLNGIRHVAELVGRAILEGKNAFKYVFKRSNQAVTPDCKCSVKVHGNIIWIDPQLLFQLITLVAHSRDNLEGVFRFVSL